jgi:cholesterol transport system auxiliary component
VQGQTTAIRRSLTYRLAAPAIALLLLPGCGTFFGGGGPAPEIFDLTAPTVFDGRGRSRAQLLVPAPAAVAALSSTRIAVRPDPARIAYYPGAVWSDELPALVQLKLVRAFENSGRAQAAARPGESLAIDYQVIIDIRAFEIDIEAGVAHVELGVKLLDDTNGRVRASRVVTVRVPARADAAPEAVAALNAAADQALSEVVNWTVSTI